MTQPLLLPSVANNSRSLSYHCQSLQVLFFQLVHILVYIFWEAYCPTIELTFQTHPQPICLLRNPPCLPHIIWAPSSCCVICLQLFALSFGQASTVPLLRQTHRGKGTVDWGWSSVCSRMQWKKLAAQYQSNVCKRPSVWLLFAGFLPCHLSES